MILIINQEGWAVESHKHCYHFPFTMPSVASAAVEFDNTRVILVIGRNSQ